MENFRKYLISLVLLFVPVVDSMALQDTISDDLYIAGIQEIEAGNFERAAELWIAHTEQLDQPDFSLAYDLIKLVTEHRLTRFYEKSSDLYFWGLQSDLIDGRAQERLRNELFYIDSMIGYREKRQLEDKIDDRDTEIFDFLEQFWQEKSMTPADTYNERLPQVNVFIVELERGDATDFDGRFDIQNVAHGTYTFRISSIGFTTIERRITVDAQNQVFNFAMREDVRALDDIVVTAFGLGREERSLG